MILISKYSFQFESFNRASQTYLPTHIDWKWYWIQHFRYLRFATIFNLYEIFARNGVQKVHWKSGAIFMALVKYLVESQGCHRLKRKCESLGIHIQGMLSLLFILHLPSTTLSTMHLKASFSKDFRVLVCWSDHGWVLVLTGLVSHSQHKNLIMIFFLLI